MHKVILMYTHIGILIMWLIKGRLGLEAWSLIEIVRDFLEQAMGIMAWSICTTGPLNILHSAAPKGFFHRVA